MTTLKGIRVSDVKINNCIFADQRPDTFCTAHVLQLMGWLCYEELLSDEISFTPLVSLFLIFIGKLFIVNVIYFSHL